MDSKLDRIKVLNAIQTALPYYAIGGETTPTKRMMELFGASRRYLYEELGFDRELDAELKDLNINYDR